MRARESRMRNSIRRRKDVERRALPTPERLRRAGADVERGHSGQITMRDSPLERAFARNAITAEQYSAGQKYRHHWYRKPRKLPARSDRTFWNGRCAGKLRSSRSATRWAGAAGRKPMPPRSSG